MANDPWSQFKAFADQAGRAGAPAAPLVAMAERFAAAARTYMAEAVRAPAAAAGNFTNVLREQAMAGLQFPWSNEPATAAAPWMQMGETVALGLTREHQQRWQRAADAARRVAAAQRRLQYLWSDALRDASSAFAAQILARPAVPSDASLREMYDSWIDCAEQAYSNMAHGEAFCTALAEFVNAGSLWRQEFAAGLEQWSKLLDLPTRSELNSVYARLQSLEAQLRAARRQPQAHAVPKRPVNPRTAPKRPVNPRTAPKRAANARAATTRRAAPAGAKRAPKS